jgi:hypothetical protein
MTYELSCNSNLIFSDIRESDKVPNGIIILDARVYDMLHCTDQDEVKLTTLPGDVPICTEIHLDIISKRDLQNHTVAQAISERIDDFQEHFEGLILQTGQEFELSDLGISFVVRSLSPTDPATHAARISWKKLLKIHLGALESKPSNLCIIVEVAAATQIADVRIRSDVMTRHQAILYTLDAFEQKTKRFGNDARFAGLVFSNEVLPFITFNTQTGNEEESTSIDSPSLIGAFRKWVDTALDEFVERPSNPGAALKRGLEIAQSLSENNGLMTTIVFFSSGVYSAGQNPVKVTRKNVGDQSVRVITISVGDDSAVDIMDAIAKEGNGTSFHMDSEERVRMIVDSINDMMVNRE